MTRLIILLQKHARSGYVFIQSKKWNTDTLKKSEQEHLKEGKSQVMCMSVQQLAWKCLHNTLVLWNISVCHTPVELNPQAQPAYHRAPPRWPGLFI